MRLIVVCWLVTDSFKDEFIKKTDRSAPWRKTLVHRSQSLRIQHTHVFTMIPELQRMCGRLLRWMFCGLPPEGGAEETPFRSTWGESI